MNSNEERIYFNQNMIFHKDKIFNSGGSLEVSICNSTIDYKIFSAPTLHISVIGENNLRRLCSLSYSDAGDLLLSIKDIIDNSETIFTTNRNNTIIKKYQFDRSLKFEFVYVQTINEKAVSIYVTHSSSDFTKVVIPYQTFLSFARILKSFVNEYVNISFQFNSRNLLTEILEQNKMIKNGIQVLPSMLIDKNLAGSNSYPPTTSIQDPNDTPVNLDMESTIEGLDKFLGKDMENIKVPDLEDKSLTEEKSKNLEINSLFITNTLNKDLSILESMLTAVSTTPDPINALCSSFIKSMNLSNDFNFLTGITQKDLRSLLYVSKITHDTCMSLYINQNKPIPSSFPILKYKIPDFTLIDSFNLNLAYDLLLIFGFIKIFRSRMESKVSDANKNGALFYLKIRTFLDPFVYSFLDISKSKIVFNTVITNFEKYSEIGFFKHYQTILTEHGFTKIKSKDIQDFCNEINDKVFKQNVLNKNVGEKHDDLFKAGFLKIKSDNNLSLEQIINELIPLEILGKNGVNLEENSESLKQILTTLKVSKPVLDVIHQKEPEKEKKTNLFKTAKFYNDEIPEKYRKDFFLYLEVLQYNDYDFSNDKFPIEELGENIVKTLYVWNSSDKRDELLTSFRFKLEECILTKELIIANYKNNGKEEKATDGNWNLSFE